MLSVKRGGLRFHHCFVFSLALHLCVILVPLWVSHRSPVRTKAQRSKLQIDLMGLISDRQMEARVQRQDIGRPQQVQNSPGNPGAPGVSKVLRAESPVQVNEVDRPKPAEQAPPFTPTPQVAAVTPGATGASGNSDAEQRQQRLGTVEEQEANQVRRYIAKLAKSLRSNLAYPDQARKQKIEGTSTVSFVVTESGGLKDSTLVVRVSSGCAALDSSALKSVRTSSPFEKPPKELRITVALAFNIGMGQGPVHRASLN